MCHCNCPREIKYGPNRGEPKGPCNPCWKEREMAKKYKVSAVVKVIVEGTFKRQDEDLNLHDDMRQTIMDALTIDMFPAGAADIEEIEIDEIKEA